MENTNKSSVKKILLCVLIPIAIILAFVGGYLSRYIFNSKAVNTATDVINIIERLGYVYDPETGEEREITEEEIADLLVSGILDIYSDYYSEEEFNAVNQSAEGKFSGVGISLYSTGEIATVTLNSPAELAGLKAGDKIISLTVDGATYLYASDGGAELTEQLKQRETGKPLTLTVERGEEQKSFEMVKSNYIASYVKYYDNQSSLNFRDDGKGGLKAVEGAENMPELDGATGYIQLVSFNGGASEQVKDALEYMKRKGKTKLILDLRDNGGGYLDILLEIANYLIDNGGKSRNLIAYAEGKSGSQYFYSGKNEFYANLASISVLADENTASASECLIGAMLHYKDGFDESKLIIEKNAKGEARTYGKGIMQTTYGLVGGGALKLTTAKIYLPDKTTSIHAVGFRPQAQNAVEKGGALARAIELLTD